MTPEERHALELRDWPKDFDGENGKYSNKCVYCGHQFLGYKRRVVCKFCAAAHSAAAVSFPKNEWTERVDEALKGMNLD